MTWVALGRGGRVIMGAGIAVHPSPRPFFLAFAFSLQDGLAGFFVQTRIGWVGVFFCGVFEGWHNGMGWGWRGYHGGFGGVAFFCGR